MNLSDLLSAETAAGSVLTLAGIIVFETSRHIRERRARKYELADRKEEERRQREAAEARRLEYEQRGPITLRRATRLAISAEASWVELAGLPSDYVTEEEHFDAERQRRDFERNHLDKLHQTLLILREHETVTAPITDRPTREQLQELVAELTKMSAERDQTATDIEPR